MIDTVLRANGCPRGTANRGGRDTGEGRDRSLTAIDAMRSLLDALCAPDLTLEEAKRLRAQLASLLARRG